MWQTCQLYIFQFDVWLSALSNLIGFSVPASEMVSASFMWQRKKKEMALVERLKQHAICGFIKRLFTSLTLQGQLVGGSLAWHTESEYTRINRQNKDKVKLPLLEHDWNDFSFSLDYSVLDTDISEEPHFPLCFHPLPNEGWEKCSWNYVFLFYLHKPKLHCCTTECHNQHKHRIITKKIEMLAKNKS